MKNVKWKSEATDARICICGWGLRDSQEKPWEACIDLVHGDRWFRITTNTCTLLSLSILDTLD